MLRARPPGIIFRIPDLFGSPVSRYLVYQTPGPGHSERPRLETAAALSEGETTMDLIRELLSYSNRPLLGNPAWAWATAVLLALVVFFVLLILRRSLGRRLKARAEESKNLVTGLIAELVTRVWVLVLLMAGVAAGTVVLDLPARLQFLLHSGLVVLALIQGGLWANALLAQWLQRRLREQSDGARSTAVVMLSFGGKLAVWSVIFLLSLANLGIDVTALIAGLGVGGIAVALAAQNILGDLFASVAIALDKPFEIGDFIIVGDLMGVVEHIGLKTSRIRSLFGEQIVMSNSDLLGSRIRNYKRMKERRVVFSIGVTYQTPAAKLEEIVVMLKSIISALPDVRFDRAHFQKYGDFALIFEAVYYVLSADYNLYMDRQQSINLDLYRRFAEAGIEFAYPTQTLFVEKLPAPAR